MSPLRVLALACVIATALSGQSRRPAHVSRLDLHEGWRIQSSAAVPAGGAAISLPGFDTAGWYGATVPTTVLAALVDAGVYPDPYFGMNLRSIPGTSYDWGDDFTHYPTPPESPFYPAWWYRTEFRLDDAGARRPRLPGRRYYLHFDSINYRASVWLNGHLVAGPDEVAGMYRVFEFDVTDFLQPGANALAVAVTAPTETDLALTFVDWNPMPADKDLGLVRDVYLLASGAVTLRNPQVLSTLEPALDMAHVQVFADLANASAKPAAGSLTVTIGNISVSKPVTLAAGEQRRIAIGPEDAPQLNLANPQLWWPAGVGPQNLYTAHFAFVSEGAVSDSGDVSFGIRDVRTEMSGGHRVFRINGKRILIRGAGWTHDMMLRVDPQREEAEFAYTRDMHLNALRLEGKMFDEHFFELADRYGILILPGWCCCGFWERWDQWTPAHFQVAEASMRDQARRLRNHPSVVVFLYGSDNAPPPDVEDIYIRVLSEENWPNPYLSSAIDTTTPGAGATGVKMTGPYDYVAPNYWLLDTRRGGAWGFLTEGGPGPAIMPLASLQQALGPDHLWPIDNWWNFHSGSGSFADVDNFTAGMNGRYGPARDLADYLRKSQAMTYEGERAMYEAYGRNKYTSTGLIHWLLNNAWPSMIWHLYDYYLRPAGGYFGAKKANELLHVQYSYDDRSVVVVNSFYQVFSNCSVTARVYNFNLSEKFSQTDRIDVPEDSSTRVFYLPDISGLSTTYFVRLELRDSAGTLVSSNFYWLSTRDDVSDWNATDGRHTPISTYADLTALQDLPAAKVALSAASTDEGPDRVEHVTVRNTSQALAFLVHLTVLKGQNGTDIAPVLWEDNYFSLMPGEERQVSARYARDLLGGASPAIAVDGWNIAP